MVLDRLDAHEVAELNAAGNRESVIPGIGERVERLIVYVLKRLGHVPVG
jgi:hypothetical protein